MFTGEAPLGRPYWWDGIEWPELMGAPPDNVDLLVIGAGYTGLSAAMAAHDAGATVAVIEAGLPGQGASTRNGGMVGAHPRVSWDDLSVQYGTETADALFTEAGAALGWMEAMLEREGIDCGYARTGRIQLAYTPAHLERQRRLAADLRDKGGVTCEIAEDLSGEISTPLYHGGLLFPRHGGLNPAKYLLGMLEAVLRRGVPVIAECPAQDVQRAGVGHLVDTPKGRIKASKVVLSTNGYTRGPFGWFARRVFPLPSYLIATEPLSENLIGTLVPGRRMMVETRARHSYFRVSPDGTRILFGGRAAMVPIGPERAALRLRETMCEIWPELADVKLSHVWTGNTGFTFSNLPHVGVRDGIHFALGYSGGGTVLAPYLGRKVALLALGSAEGETAYTRTAFVSKWYHPGGAPLFLTPADWMYRHWVDRQETRQKG